MTDVERIIEELRPVAEKLGEGAVEVYKLAVRQALIEGLSSGIVCLMLFGLTFGGVMIARYLWRKSEAQSSSYTAENFRMGGILTLVASVVTLIIGVVYLIEALQYVLNPKWAAVEQILKALP